MQIDVSKAQFVRDTILAHSGQFFTVEFIKRTNGERRVMNAHLTDRKHKTKPAYKYNPAAKNLLPVFDLKKNAWRMVNLPEVKRLRIAGTEYVFLDAPPYPGVEDEADTVYVWEATPEARFAAIKAQTDALFY